MQSVAGSRYAHPLGGVIGANVTPAFRDCVANCNNVTGQRQVGSSAGAAPPRKDIKGAQRSAQAGQNPAIEGKAKSRPDWIPKRIGSRGESRA
jgi:hypothetical protein